MKLWTVTNRWNVMNKIMCLVNEGGWGAFHKWDETMQKRKKVYEPADSEEFVKNLKECPVWLKLKSPYKWNLAVCSTLCGIQYRYFCPNLWGVGTKFFSFHLCLQWLSEPNSTTNSTTEPHTTRTNVIWVSASHTFFFADHYLLRYHAAHARKNLVINSVTGGKFEGG